MCFVIDVFVCRTAVATIKEVAKKARVSVGTVSNVLSGSIPVSKQLKDRVLDVIKLLDYHPNYVARSLKIRHTRMIGMIVSDIASPHVPQLVRGAEEAARQANYMLVTCNSDDQIERERQVLGDLRSRCVDGILLIAAAGDHAHVWAVRESGIPIVCLERELPGFDCVAANNFAGARQCVKHLASRGHRRIGMLNGDLKIESASERHGGYRRGLEDEGIAYDESLVASGLELLSREPRPSAILTGNAALALGLLGALKDFGLRCPDEIAIVTFDDPGYGEALRPGLTVVAQPSFEMGRQAMELLLKRMEDPRRDRAKVVLETKLVIRESSGSPSGVASA